MIPVLKKILDVHPVDGELTLGENLADISGVDCILRLTQNNDQRKELFENYARIWASLTPKDSVLSQLYSDEHSPAIIRVNAVVPLFDQFYEIYDVKEGDAKHSLKNIFSKPLRLLLLVFCITFASFAALLAVDMRNNIEGLMKGYMMDMIGKMDIIIMNASPEALEEVEDIADIRKVGISQAGLYEYERDTTGYEYSFEKYIDVTAISDMKITVMGWEIRSNLRQEMKRYLSLKSLSLSILKISSGAENISSFQTKI